MWVAAIHTVPCSPYSHAAPEPCNLHAGLNDILELREKCVVQPCMHVFCISCLTTWARQKKVCPLCKVRSYLDRWMDEWMAWGR